MLRIFGNTTNLTNQNYENCVHDNENADAATASLRVVTESEGIELQTDEHIS